MKISFNLRMKEIYSNDVKTIYDFYKINHLLNDKNASVRIICNDFNATIFKNNNVGNVLYSEEQNNAFLKNLDLFEKVIYIENYFNIKFSYDVDVMFKSVTLIEIVYASITKNDTFIGTDFFNYSIIYQNENINNLSVGEFISFESKFDFLILFDKKIKLENTFIKSNCALIKEINNNIINLELKSFQIFIK